MSKKKGGGAYWLIVVRAMNVRRIAQEKELTVLEMSLPFAPVSSPRYLNRSSKKRGMRPWRLLLHGLVWPASLPMVKVLPLPGTQKA